MDAKSGRQSTHRDGAAQAQRAATDGEGTAAEEPYPQAGDGEEAGDEVRREDLLTPQSDRRAGLRPDQEPRFQAISAPRLDQGACRMVLDLSDPQSAQAARQHAARVTPAQT